MFMRWPKYHGKRVGVDVIELGNQHFPVTEDYFSNFQEINVLSSISALLTIKKLQVHFAQYDISPVLIIDNGPQFISTEFSDFAVQYNFQYKTFNPKYG